MVEMPQGQSYTGQKQAEIFCHGGQFVLKQILEEIFKYDVRPAEPGEFTRRAFLSGKIDLARAEAVADLIASKTEYSYNAAKNNLLGRMSEYIDSIRAAAVEILAEIEASIDFPEEDTDTAEQKRLSDGIDKITTRAKELAESYRAGQIIKEGYKIAVAGRPNAGKSSLFNLMLNQNRAIVAPSPGTTRDYLTEWIDLDGVAVAVSDTAGLRSKAGVVEKAGQESALSLIKNSDLVIWITDISRKNWIRETAADIAELPENSPVVIAVNKIDNIETLTKKSLDKLDGIGPDIERIPLSCKTKAGFKLLRKRLAARINENMPDLTDRLVLTSARHKKKLDNFIAALGRAKKKLNEAESPEIIAFELRQGINEIDEITGRIYNDEILENIFSRFCIGK